MNKGILSVAVLAMAFLTLNTKVNAQSTTTVHVSVELDPYIGSLDPSNSIAPDGSAQQKFVFKTPQAYADGMSQETPAQMTPTASSPLSVSVKGSGDFKNAAGKTLDLGILSIQVRAQSPIEAVAAGANGKSTTAVSTVYGAPILLTAAPAQILSLPAGNKVALDVRYNIDLKKNKDQSAIAAPKSNTAADVYTTDVVYTYTFL